MPFDLQNTNYDSLLDDPIEEPVVEEPVEEEIPMIPDPDDVQESNTETNDDAEPTNTYSGVVAEWY